MLAYLDALLGALSVRDGDEVERLLSHPLARVLPAAAQQEARMIGRGEGDALTAPLRVMQLRHLTAELLRDVPVVADRAVAESTDAQVEATPASPGGARARAVASRAPSRGARQVQMELPLSA